MNKILRISMIAVLALIANFSFAGVSTIDFTKLSVNPKIRNYHPIHD